MERATPKHGRSGKSVDKYAALPHEIGRQGAKFLPGGGESKDRGSDKNTWAGDVGKASKEPKAGKKKSKKKGDEDTDD